MKQACCRTAPLSAAYTTTSPPQPGAWWRYSRLRVQDEMGLFCLCALFYPLLPQSTMPLFEEEAAKASPRTLAVPVAVPHAAGERGCPWHRGAGLKACGKRRGAGAPGGTGKPWGRCRVPGRAQRSASIFPSLWFSLALSSASSYACA